MRGLQLISVHLEQRTQRPISVPTPIINVPKTPPPQEEEVTPPPPPSDDLPKTGAESASSESRLMSTSRLTEVLELLAEEKNVVMIPKPGRTQNGKQIYGFGSISIYTDSGVIYAYSENREWEIVSLNELLKRV